ncbi:hypothetical protein MLD38_004842 [Melastoma candidum]|uniref:Uncharacterized protein n=1 Tax=Melastoma candidum TaxID=119954 RepID=A0ACB9S6H4_9MYRT|nr:hypothetical protein MLD38_004842 [Melastoma candidum]
MALQESINYPPLPTPESTSAAATKLHFPEHERLTCPRCQSTNTKFCYFNNYNLSQPRHFCKSCKRYWTKGGSLRNIPVGGTTRKPNKKDSPAKKPGTIAPDRGQRKPDGPPAEGRAGSGPAAEPDLRSEGVDARITTTVFL